ncbi:hypothetical protein DHEL01_v204196 [Diaporthe helianthi]|uniref:Protein kinase domain-containing protein n=1 Tax=Diaporthe helianthi TaxID=158607 RepID=A0A2P5I4I0_DIAHE|nr:hypothetical protein DHEL01_v204196 [Diaporthe helianthi]
MADNPFPTPPNTIPQWAEGTRPINPPTQSSLTSSSSFWNPSSPRTPSQVARMRYRENEYFRLWRRGLKHEWQGPRWNLPVGDLPARRSGRWGGQASMESAGVERRREAERDPIRYYPSAGSSPPLDITAPARAAVRRLQGASLVKILGFGGFGGFGIAALLDVASKQGGTLSRVVMKTVIGDDGWASEDLKTEKKWQTSLMRAMHVVGLVRWSTLRGTPVALEDALIDDDPKLFFMELMKHGDLQQAIGRAGNRGEKLPSRLLWKVFACHRIDTPTETDWKSQDGPAILEQVPDQVFRDSRDYDLIHFDLDPQNRDFHNMNHAAVPSFKIADLGLAERNRGELLTDVNNITKNGNGPKPDRAKCSFNCKWRRITDHGVTYIMPGWVLKLTLQFQKCMHMLITLYTFPYPPLTVGPFNSQGLPQQYASVGVIHDHMGAQVTPFYTNGAGLVDEDGLDSRLRNLLMRCLAVVPANRPGLEELEVWAGQAESNPGFFASIGGDLSSTELADHFISPSGYDTDTDGWGSVG